MYDTFESALKHTLGTPEGLARWKDVLQPGATALREVAVKDMQCKFAQVLGPPVLPPTGLAAADLGVCAEQLL